MEKRLDSTKTPDADSEPVGAGGKVGEGQAGQPLHKPKTVEERERVGAGGPVGDDSTPR